MQKDMFRWCAIVTAAHPSIMIYPTVVALEDRVEYSYLEMQCKKYLKQVFLLLV